MKRKTRKSPENMRMYNKGPDFYWEVKEVFSAKLMFDLRSE